MTHGTSNAVARRMLAAVTVAAALVALAAGPSLAGTDEPGQKSLVGTWRVQVTLRNCTTGAPLGPPFESLVTFHRDGTIGETAAAPAFAPGQRSPGHGLWTRGPARTFTQSMVALILFDTPPNLPGTPGFDPGKLVTPGFFTGWQTVSHTVTPTDADHLTSAGTNAFYKSTGELYRTGCSTAAAQRLE